MKLAHSVRINVFAHEQRSEDPQLIKEKLVALIPFDLEKEKIKVSETKATSATETTIMIFEVVLEKQRHVSQFLKELSETISKPDKQKLQVQLDSRLDESCDFFLRFDKQTWIDEGKLLLTDSGDCFHVKITVAAYPKNKENAKKAIKAIFSL